MKQTDKYKVTCPYSSVGRARAHTRATALIQAVFRSASHRIRYQQPLQKIRFASDLTPLLRLSITVMNEQQSDFPNKHLRLKIHFNQHSQTRTEYINICVII